MPSFFTEEMAYIFLAYEILLVNLYFKKKLYRCFRFRPLENIKDFRFFTAERNYPANIYLLEVKDKIT